MTRDPSLTLPSGCRFPVGRSGPSTRSPSTRTNFNTMTSPFNSGQANPIWTTTPTTTN